MRKIRRRSESEKNTNANDQNPYIHCAWNDIKYSASVFACMCVTQYMYILRIHVCPPGISCIQRCNLFRDNSVASFSIQHCLYLDKYTIVLLLPLTIYIYIYVCNSSLIIFIWLNKDTFVFLSNNNFFQEIYSNINIHFYYSPFDVFISQFVRK